MRLVDGLKFKPFLIGRIHVSHTIYGANERIGLLSGEYSQHLQSLGTKHDHIYFS